MIVREMGNDLTGNSAFIDVAKVRYLNIDSRRKGSSCCDVVITRRHMTIGDGLGMYLSQSFVLTNVDSSRLLTYNRLVESLG